MFGHVTGLASGARFRRECGHVPGLAPGCFSLQSQIVLGILATIFFVLQPSRFAQPMSSKPFSVRTSI